MAQYDNAINLYVPLYNLQYGTVRASINNGCGTSAYSGITVYPAYNCGYYYVYYPNPTTAEISVEAIDATTEKAFDATNVLDFSVSLFDVNQKLVKDGQADKNKLTINVSDLPKGSYFLHITSKEQTTKEQILIE